MRKQHSLIPPKAQIPAVIVLSCFFALVLYWRFSGSTEADAAPEDEVTRPAEEVNILNELREHISAAQSGFEHATAELALPEVVRNPFEPPRAVRSAGGDSSRFTSPASGFKRKTFLESVTVSGILIMRDGGIAVINGSYVREGESINGFILRHVGTDEIILEDRLGRVSIQVKAPWQE